MANPKIEARNPSVAPFIGENFQATRLLLLGESTYSWRNEQGELVCPSPNHPTECVREIPEGRKLFPWQRFWTCCTHALANKENPTPDQTRAAWERVAVANYVPGTIGEGA